MNRTSRSYWSLLLCLLLTSPAVAQPGKIIWGGDEEGGAPYVFKDKNLNRIGYEVDLAEALARELGRTIEFKQFSYDSLIPGLNQKEFDFAMNGLEPTEARREAVRFTRPYYIYQQQMVVRAGEKRFADFEQFKAMPERIVGTMDGTEAAMRLAETLGEGRVKGYQAPTDAYQDLKNGNVDAVVMDLPMAISYAKPDPALRYAGPPFWKSTYAIACRKDDAALVEQINDGFRRMLEKGTLQTIYQKWGLWNHDQLELLREFELVPRTCEPLAAQDAQEADKIYEGMREGWPIASYLPLLLEGAWVTIQLAVCGFALAMLLGLPLALARLYGPLWLRSLAIAYIEFFRGIPVLLLLFFLYFGLPIMLGQLGVPFALDPFVAATIGLGLNYAAYEAEIYRAGIGSVPPGQWEAAASLGMPPTTSFRRIILPQALRMILPPMTGDFVACFKDTSIASMVAVVELNKQYQILAKSSLKFFEIGLITAAIYLILSIPLGYLSRYLEDRWTREQE